MPCRTPPRDFFATIFRAYFWTLFFLHFSLKMCQQWSKRCLKGSFWRSFSMHSALFFSNPKTMFRLRRRSRIACAPSQDDPIFRPFFASPSDSVPSPHPAPLFHAFYRFRSQNGAPKGTQGVDLERGFRTFWGSWAPLGATMAPRPRPRAPRTPPNLDFW